MKTIVTTIIIASIFTAESFANGNQKRYEITDHGQYHFTYPLEQDALNNKGGIKPVTERTFYLETARQGLIPEGMTYSTFIQLTIEEKQAILKNRQFELTARMDNAPVNLVTAKAILAQVHSTAPSQSVMPVGQHNAELDVMVPWLVKAVTRPGTEHNLPTDPMVLEDAVNNDLPWAVDVILNEAQQTNEKQMAAILKSVSTLTATK